MKNDKSKSNFLKLNSVPDSLKKQIAIQKEVSKKYQKFKKSASQPAYFLNQSRLKKISQVYRVASLEKLSKNYSFNRSKSLHNNVTPEKKQSTLNNASFKRQSGVSTLNINKAFETNEKTKRLRLDKTLQNQNSHTLQTPTQTATKFFATQVDRLQQITNLNTEKAFVAQYDYFFKAIKEECFNRKGYASQVKSLVSKFCYLMELCQSKMSKINQREEKTKYSKIEIDFANVSAQLKKKSFKLELLIKEIDQLKLHNMKIAKEICDLKEEKRSSFGSQKSINKKKRHFQISNIFEVKVHGHQSQLTTPIISHPNPINNSSEQQFNEQKKISSNNNVQRILSNYNGEYHQMANNERLQMIKRIRELERKQKELVKTLMVLKTDGVDVERAFNEVVTGQVDGENVDISGIDLEKKRIPSYIKKIKNKDSYEADSSIVESIQGLTVRYFDGQPEEEYIFYPIKHEYKSKQLDETLQNKLKLNFEVLYEDYEQPPQSQSQQSQEQESGCQESPTI